MSVKGIYFKKFKNVNDLYLTVWGEGNTKATQIVTAVCKLIYKWYNDGDVFDNKHYVDGWRNDISSYANWLDQNTDKGSEILHRISNCECGSDYEDLLKEIADTLLDEEYLLQQNEIKKAGSIYECDGFFKFEENWDDEEDEYIEEDDDIVKAISGSVGEFVDTDREFDKEFIERGV